MSGPANPIVQNGAFYPDTLDPMLAAIRQSLVDATTGALAEFGEKQVIVVPPDETEQGIDAKIGIAMAQSKGLALCLVAGSGKNPDKDAPGPRLNVELEAQLYVSTRIRGKAARTPMELMVEVMRLFHHASIRVSGFPWWERIFVTGFSELPDPDYTAYAITMEREFQL